MRTAALLALALAVLPGCKKKSSDDAAAKQAPPTATTDQAAAAKSKIAAQRVANFPRLSLAQLTVEEILPFIPEVKGTDLGEPIAQAGGRQVRKNVCLAGTDLAALAPEVQQALTAKGFTTSQPQQRGTTEKPRMVVTGQQDDYRVSANLMPSSNPGCSGKAEVLFTFHRVVKRAAGSPAAAEPATQLAPDSAGATKPENE